MPSNENLSIRFQADALLDRRSESTLVCRACGREFYAYDLRHYSLALEAARLRGQNRGRALSHTRGHVLRGEVAR